VGACVLGVPRRVRFPTELRLGVTVKSAPPAMLVPLSL
jgi:hypothetical protein